MQVYAYLFKGQGNATHLRLYHDSRSLWFLNLGLLRHVGISESVRGISVNSVIPFDSVRISLDIDETTPPIPSMDLLWDWVASHICPEDISDLLTRLEDYPELLHKLVDHE